MEVVGLPLAGGGGRMNGCRMWDCGMKDPQLQYAQLKDLGCTSMGPRICGHRMLGCRHMATGSEGSGMHGCRIWDARLQDAGPQGPGYVAAGCRMYIHRIQDVHLWDAGCWAAGHTSARSETQGCRIWDAGPQDAECAVAGSGTLGHGMNRMLNVRWQLLAELEALQKDALVAGLQHSSLLQVLLCDVTGNEAQIWASLPPMGTPLGGARARAQVAGCPPRLHLVPAVGFCDPWGAVGILRGKGHVGAVRTPRVSRNP